MTQGREQTHSRVENCHDSELMMRQAPKPGVYATRY